LLDMALTPTGHPVLFETIASEQVDPNAATAALPEGAVKSLREAFQKGPSELLLCLATLPDRAALPPVFAFWRGLGERYLTELCHIPEPAENLMQPLPAPLDELAEMACSAVSLPRPLCLLAGGELTVTVRGKGRGGRNTEFVLASLVELGKSDIEGLDWLILSLGTDGLDGPTDAAGAWADASTVERARGLGLDPAASLDDNDSYSFFKRTENLIITGPTGTNVMDLRVFLLRAA